MSVSRGVREEPAVRTQAPVPDAGRPRRRAPLLRAVRPRQWTKNALVVVVPAAAGRVLEPAVLAATLVALAVFCLAASAVYLGNDVRDAAEDRLHPVKRLRPVAAGEVSPRVASAVAVLLAVLALGVAFWWAVPLGAVVAAYLVVQVAYSAGLKHQPVLDLAVVSSGFVMRVLAGGAATGVPTSDMLLLVASFGSMFMVSGKRFSEIRALGSRRGTRQSLELYSESYLRFVWSLSAAVTVVCYVQWAFDNVHGRSGEISWGLVSVAPLVLGMLRYAVDIDRGTAEAPEELVLRDRVLQALALVWLACMAPAVMM